ncbi:hypothetical protein, partial [Demequina sp.]|uniref:hypothetical protein n=1 Tax=Demequina sp. TaxID=2050685 RepID=UPI003D138130
AVGAAAGAVLVSATAWSWPGRPLAGDVEGTDVNVLPLVAALELEPPASERVLTLSDIDGGVAYSVLTADGSVVVWGNAGFSSSGAPLARPAATSLPSPDDLAEAVGTLVAAGIGADSELAAWGIGVIVVTPDSSRALAGLSQVDSLELMGASGLGTAYRVTRDGDAVSRAWVTTDDASVAVAWDGAEGAARLTAQQAGTLVIAAPADRGWAATLDGRTLDAVDDDLGRQAFTVPAGGGELDVRFDDTEYRRWWWAAAVACGLSLLAALPFFDRRMLGGRA